jgi:hypothetical protein
MILRLPPALIKTKVLFVREPEVGKAPVAISELPENQNAELAGALVKNFVISVTVDT